MYINTPKRKKFSDKNWVKRIIIVNRFKDIDPKDRELINDSIIDIAKIRYLMC